MHLSALDLAFQVFITQAFRYILFAGGAFLLFYIILKQKWEHKKIQGVFPAKADYKREIIYSFLTILIFVLVAIFLFATPIRQHTQVYANIADYGLPYWFFSILLMILIHDTYFYWTHRIMHHPKLFKTFHLIHHKSTNPSPWAAYAFHPLEGIVEAGIVIVIAFLMPFHVSALLLFLLFMIIYNVYGHLGYELYPRKFNQHSLGKWINTSVNHNLHHKHFHGNYGLYFLFWDRLMGTISKDYDSAFKKATEHHSPKKDEELTHY